MYSVSVQKQTKKVIIKQSIMPVEKQEVEDERTETKTTPEMKQKTVEDVIAQKGELTNQQRQSPQKRRWRRLTNPQEAESTEES